MKLTTWSLLIIFFSGLSYGQVYPRWFLFPSILKCESTVGYAVTGFYKDSSLVAAFNNCSINMAINSFYTVKGGQGFWTTEIGSIWMGKDIKVFYDTSMADYYCEILLSKDSYEDDRLLIVLALEKDCELSHYEKELVTVSDLSEPDWISTPPKSKKYYFATGESTKYYYESNSWLEAENNARINLARQVGIQIQSLEKYTGSEGQSLSKEEISLSLSHVRVVERWFNTTKNVFYVLVQMPKI